MMTGSNVLALQRPYPWPTFRSAEGQTKRISPFLSQKPLPLRSSKCSTQTVSVVSVHLLYKLAIKTVLLKCYSYFKGIFQNALKEQSSIMKSLPCNTNVQKPSWERKSNEVKKYGAITSDLGVRF